MLVLTRKEGESILIGENIWVMVVEIQDGAVRLGIDAPRKVPVHRKEVAERIALAEAHVDAGTIGLGEDQLDAAENCDALHLQCPDKCPMFGELCDVCTRWPYGNSHNTGQISLDNVIPETGMECCETSSADACCDCDGSPAIDDQFTGDLPPGAAEAPVELPPNAELTNDQTKWEERSRPAAEWEMQEEYEAARHRSPFG